MSSFVSQQFGKYQLLEKIGVGGMAELFKAKVIGEGGFEKLVAIKRILPHLSEEQDLISMFVDEARLAALLSHQNIVQIYDFGKECDTYFIAMEYLEGKDLRAVLRKANNALPLGYALHIASRICAGLDYSHSLKDLKGNALNLIHRDISPQNVFITYSGEIKILDFGIAKAANRRTLAHDRVLKGKVSYMSPEQAAGKAVDRRSDIFSTGVLLYEMIAGVRMFHGDTGEMLEQVREAEFEPIESVAHGLPAGVCELVRKGLAKDPDERYQSCGEMLAALEECLAFASSRPTAEGLSKFLQGLFDPIGSSAETIGVLHGSSRREAGPDRAAMGGTGLIESTETVFDEEVTEELEPSSIERSRSRRWEIRPGFVSFGVLAALLAIMIFVSGDPSKKNVGENPQHKAVEFKSSESGKALSISKNVVLSQPEGSEKTRVDYTRALLEQGMQLAAGDPDKAIVLIEKCIKRDPTYARAYFELAKIETRLRNYPKAIALYKRVGVLEPNFPDTYFNLGFLYAMIKDYSRSEKMYIRAAALSPPYLDEVYYNLAMVQAAQGKGGRSDKSLEQALAINPENKKALKYIERNKPQPPGEDEVSGDSGKEPRLTNNEFNER
jgi:serine/threonine protein kinase